MKIICNNDQILTIEDISFLANSGTYKDLCADLPTPPDTFHMAFDRDLVEQYIYLVGSIQRIGFPNFSGDQVAQQFFALADYLNDRQTMQHLYPYLSMLLHEQQLKQEHSYTVLSFNCNPKTPKMQRRHSFRCIHDIPLIIQNIVDHFDKIFSISLTRIYNYDNINFLPGEQLIEFIKNGGKADDLDPQSQLYQDYTKIGRKVLHTPIRKVMPGDFFHYKIEPDTTIYEFQQSMKADFLARPDNYFRFLRSCHMNAVCYGNIRFALAMDEQIDDNFLRLMLPTASLDTVIKTVQNVFN